MSINLSSWTPPQKGGLFVVTGASGTGKTTLVKAALARFPSIGFSVSATTRQPRKGEQDGVDYHFLTPSDFQKRIDAGDFLEWANVYGNYYGTLKSPVKKAIDNGKSILLDIDYQGAEQVRANALNSISIFVLPPNLEILEHRLRNRKTDSEQVIQRRMSEAKSQLKHCCDFDYLVVNNDLDSAHDQFQSILIAELLQSSRRQNWVDLFTKS